MAERMDQNQVKLQREKIQDLKDEFELMDMTLEDCDKFKIEIEMLDKILNSQHLFNKIPLFVNRR